MKTINSLSGGKTSSYLAKHYNADYNIFSLVKIDNQKCTPKDKFLIKFISDKIGEQFIATAEKDITLRAIIDLEQLIGKEIIWVSGLSFDKIILKNSILPNYIRRFCTTEMKIRPIFDWWFKNINQKVKMGIGYRYDEKERADRFTTTFKGITGKRKTRNKWEELEWREGFFPLIDDKINHFHVKKWADTTNLNFPLDSNCVGCFHKPLQQIRKNWDLEPEKMQWFSNMEKIGKGRFQNNFTYEQAKFVGLQNEFNFGTGSGCEGGFCTD